MMMKRVCLLYILLLLMVKPSKSQESFQGLPSITNYSSEDFHSIEQTWNAVQDDSGVMFFGNTNGILRFDGNTWKLIPISRFMSIIRSIEKSSDGILYIGSIDNFGYLQSTKTGSIEYISLSSQLPDNRSSFNDIWHIACHKDLTIFMASKYLFIYRNFQLIETMEAKERFTHVVSTGGNLYVHEKETGLYLWKNDAFYPKKEGEFLKGESLSFLISKGKDTLLAGTSDNKIFTISHGTVASGSSSLLLSKLDRITCGILLYNQILAIGTSNSGIILVNQQGEVIRKIGIHEGLISNSITGFFNDRDNNLWVTTQSGITYIEICSPFTFFQKPYGLTQPVMETALFENNLYIAGTDALYTMPYAKPLNPYEILRFQVVEGSLGQSWQLKSDSEKLYVSHNPGLLTVEKQKLTFHRLNQSNVYNIVFSSSLSDKFIVSVDNGLLLVDKEDFTYKKVWSGKETPRYLVLGESNELWMITESLQGVYRMKFTPTFDSIKSCDWYSTDKGLPDQAVLSLLHTKAGLIVLTEEGLFLYDKQNDIFIKESYCNSLMRPGANLANIDNKCNIWLCGMNYLAQLIQDIGGFCQVRDTVFRRINAFTILHSYSLPDNSWLFSTNKGVIRYDATQNIVPKLYRPIINEIQSFSDDSLLYQQEFFENPANHISTPGSTRIIPEFPYISNSFRFMCASVCYVEARKCRFRYRLDEEGKPAEAWSEWSDSPIKEYTNLSEGSYTFRVISQDVYNQVSPETTFQFVVLPPWYRTLWAYGAYIFLGLIIFYFGIRINTMHLKAANIRLEKTITERTREIERQKSEIQELNEFKTRFYSNISHELRTPLTLIICPLEQLQNHTDDPMLKKNYGIMLRNAHRLMLLINQMLELSKLDKGLVKLNLEKLTIGPILNQIIESFSLYASTMNIELSLKEEEANISMLLDRDILEKILHNLLSNALKFTESGGKVTVLIRYTDDRENIQIDVSDTGTGIQEKELSRIFERFYQVDKPNESRNEGIGIGLAFVKELVELHNGSVSVKSSMARGSTFTILLPLQPLMSKMSTEKDDETMYDSIKASETVGDDLKKAEINTSVTILVVEDNEDMLSFIADTIQSTSHVIRARDGEEGLHTAIDLMPDLIITDVMMPKMNGYEMTRELKHHRLTSHIPVIMLTAKASEESRIEGLEALADDYLTKPFSTMELKIRIKNLIAIRKRLKRKYHNDLIVNPSEVTTTSIDEEFLSAAIKIVEDNISNPKFGISFLCVELAMSRPTLHRKLKALTNQSTSEFIKTIRLKHAARLIKGKAGSISEIAYMVGFNTIPYFNVSFKKQFGVTPSEFI